MTKDPTELHPGEFHPAALSALEWIKAHDVKELCLTQEACASCAIEGNRTAEVCSGTLDRLLTGKPVGERYILGLAWFMSRTEADK